MDQMRAFNEMLLHFMNATESPLPCISRRGGVSDGHIPSVSVAAFAEQPADEEPDGNK